MHSTVHPWTVGARDCSYVDLLHMPSPPINQGSFSSLMARVAHLEKAITEDAIPGDLATKIADRVVEKLPMRLQPLLYDAKCPDISTAKYPPVKPNTSRTNSGFELSEATKKATVDAAPTKEVDGEKWEGNGAIAEEKLTRGMSTRSNGERKLTMACDHDVDPSTMTLKEEANLGSVFSHESDPSKPMFRVEFFYHDKGYCQALARSSYFANLTIIIVVLNAVYLGIDSDHNHFPNLYDAEWSFQVASQFFCVYFTFELLIRFVAFKKKTDCLRDGWFKFDLFLVGTMILDVWVLMPIMKIVTTGEDLPIPTQPLRMLRLLKLSRMARLMRAFPELITMIKGLVRSLRAIFSSMVLIGLMVYTWAILIHSILKDEKNFNQQLYTDYQYDFSRLGDCIWTLLMAGTLMLDNTAPLIHALLLNDKMDKIIAGVIFMSFLVLSALCILQMVIGVLCDVVSQVGEERRDADTIGLIRQELLQDIFALNNGSNYISSKEFGQVLDGERSKALLKKLNINRMFLQQAAALMFPDEQKTVPVRAVLELMIMCKGDNIATVQIVASALCFITNELSDMQEQIVMDLGDAMASSPEEGIRQTASRHSNHSVYARAQISDAFIDGL